MSEQKSHDIFNIFFKFIICYYYFYIYVYFFCYVDILNVQRRKNIANTKCDYHINLFQ